MRVLVISVTAGGGHNSAAAALREALEARGHQVLEADLYRQCAGPLAARLVDRVYRFSAAHLRRRYHTVYARLEWEPRLRRRFLRLALPPLLCRRLQALVAEAAPDRVIATHVFPALALCRLRAAGKCPPPVDGVVTDYCLHPLWEDCDGLRRLTIAAPALAEEAVNRGVPADSLGYEGIPIRSVFRQLPDKAEARRRLGLAEKPTVLLMGGSMGYGSLWRTALCLRRVPEVQTVCICGGNRLARALLRPRAGPKLRVLGYTADMADYMAAADLAVTKPGGLTLAELAAAGLPALLTRPIPGHEERNLAFAAGLGCAAVAPGGPRATATAAASLLNDPAALTAMKTALAELARPHAAEAVAEFREALDKAENHDRIRMKI